MRYHLLWATLPFINHEHIAEMPLSWNCFELRTADQYVDGVTIPKPGYTIYSNLPNENHPITSLITTTIKLSNHNSIFAN